MTAPRLPNDLAFSFLHPSERGENAGEESLCPRRQGPPLPQRLGTSGRLRQGSSGAPLSAARGGREEPLPNQQVTGFLP